MKSMFARRVVLAVVIVINERAAASLMRSALTTSDEKQRATREGESTQITALMRTISPSGDATEFMGTTTPNHGRKDRATGRGDVVTIKPLMRTTLPKRDTKRHASVSSDADAKAVEQHERQKLDQSITAPADPCGPTLTDEINKIQDLKSETNGKFAAGEFESSTACENYSVPKPGDSSGFLDWTCPEKGAQTAEDWKDAINASLDAAEQPRLQLLEMTTGVCAFDWGTFFSSMTVAKADPKADPKATPTPTRRAAAALLELELAATTGCFNLSNQTAISDLPCDCFSQLQTSCPSVPKTAVITSLPPDARECVLDFVCNLHTTTDWSATSWPNGVCEMESHCATRSALFQRQASGHEKAGANNAERIQQFDEVTGTKACS